MTAGYKGATVWSDTHSGVCFEGGNAFGSDLYDAASDGIYVQIIVCDDCLKVAQNTDKLREIRKVHTPTKIVPVEKSLDSD